MRRTNTRMFRRSRSVSLSPPPSPTPPIVAIGGEIQEEKHEEEKEEEEELEMNRSPSVGAAIGLEEVEEEKEKEEETERDEGVRIEDRKELDCPICFGPLRPPILQCKHGWVSCSECFVRLLNKCQLCTTTAPSCSRNYALERVLDACKVSCPNKNFGCDMRVPYYKESDHKLSCSFAPCFCPAELCPFMGPARTVFDHGILTHRWQIQEFNFGESFLVSVSFLEPFKVLVTEQSDGMFLLLNKIGPMGTALSMVYVGPADLSGTDHWYELSLEPDESRGRKRAKEGRFAAPLLRSTLEEGIGNTETFLLVSDKILNVSSTNLIVRVFINAV